MTVGELFVKMSLDQSQYDQGLQEAEKKAQKSGRKIGGILDNALGYMFGKSAFNLVSSFFKSASRMAFGLNSELQIVSISMEKLLGSAKAGTAFMNELLSVSAKTPFEFRGLLDASRQMLAMQWATSRIFPDLQVIGDTLAGIGKFDTSSMESVVTALGRMKMYGKVSSREMMSLISAGIPAWNLLAEETGMSVEKLRAQVEKGALNGSAAVDTLLSAMEKRYGGMMEQLEDSWSGIWSTLGDLLELSLGEISKELFQNMNSWLIGVRDFANEFYENLKLGGLQYAIRASFGEAFADVVNIIGTTISSVGKFIAWWYNIIKNNWDVIKIVLTGLATYVTLTKGAALATTIFQFISAALSGTLATKIPILSTISTAVGIYRVQMNLASASGVVMTGVMAKLRVALYALQSALGPVGWMLIAISGLVAGGTHLWGKYKKSLMKTPKVPQIPSLDDSMKGLQGSTDGANKKLIGQEKALKKLRKEAARTLTSVDELHKIEKNMAGADGGIEPPSFGGPDIPDFGIPDMGDFLIDPITDAFDELTENASIKGFFKWIWDSWSEWVQSWKWLDKVEEAVGTFFGKTIPNAWNKFKKWITGQWNTWIADIKRQWDNFTDWLAKSWGNVKVAWVLFWAWVKTKWNKLWQDLKDGWNNFTTWLAGSWEIVKVAWNLFWAWVRAKWDGLWLGLKNGWNSFTAWLAGSWEYVKGTWNAFWEWVRTKWYGLGESIKGTWNSVTGWFSNAWNNVKGAWNNFTTWVKNWSLWSTLREKVDWVKGLFDFQWKMPKIKMPRFSVSWDKSGLWGSIGKILGLPGKPNLSVQWLAKGGVLGNATLIGAGEAGREAVLPLDRNTGWASTVAELLADSLGRNGGGSSEGPITLQVIIGGDMILDEVIDASKRRNARAGKTVIQLGV